MTRNSRTIVRNIDAATCETGCAINPKFQSLWVYVQELDQVSFCKSILANS